MSGASRWLDAKTPLTDVAAMSEGAGDADDLGSCGHGESLPW